jgi:hypothetical protein
LILCLFGAAGRLALLDQLAQSQFLDDGFGQFIVFHHGFQASAQHPPEQVLGTRAALARLPQVEEEVVFVDPWLEVDLDAFCAWHDRLPPPEPTGSTRSGLLSEKCGAHVLKLSFCCP